jgi:hypothetical protein
MRTTLLALLIVTACGGDDQQHVFMDAFIVPPSSHDLSCLDHTVAIAADPINVAGSVIDVTHVMNAPMVSNASVHLHRLSSGTEIATATSSPTGAFSLSFATGGTPARNYWDIEPDAADSAHVPTRMYYGWPWTGSGTGVTVYLVLPTRLDDIATAQGEARDASLGVLEVAIDDCSFAGFPDATIALDGADTQWTMFAGGGTWLSPRSMTGPHPQNWSPSIAARVNVPLGHHTITVTADTFNGPVTIGPIDFDVVAGAWTWLYVTPGEV